MDKEEIEKNTKIIYEAERKRFEDERDETRRLDEHARNLVGSILVVIGFLLAAGTISMIDLRSISSILYFAGIITLVTSVFIAYWSFRYKAGQIPNASFKDVQPINGSYIESVEEVCRVPTHETCKKLIAWTVEAVKHNEKKNHEKAKLISTTWRLMIVGLVMVTAFVLLSIFFSSDASETTM